MKKVRKNIVITTLVCSAIIALMGCKDNTVSSNNTSVNLAKRAASVKEIEETNLTPDNYENQVVTPNRSVQKVLVELSDTNTTYELIRRGYIQLRKSPTPQEVDLVARELVKTIYPHYCIRNIVYIPEDTWEVRGIHSFVDFSVYIIIGRK